MNSNFSKRGIILTILAPLLPASQFYDLVRLLFLGSVISCFFLFSANFAFPGGAMQFTEYSNALVSGEHLNISIAQRDIGFPLMLLLSGYPFHHSFIIITLFQAIMATLIPILCYLAVRPIFPYLAYYTGLAVILTLSPFYFMKWIHHDQCYIFFTVLSASLLVSFIAYKRAILLYGLTLAVILASLSRPAGNLLYPLVLVCGYCFVRGSISKYIISIVMFSTAIFLYSQHRFEIFDISHAKSIPSYTGKQIFYNLYINSKEFGIELSPKLGPGLNKITENVYANIQPDTKTSPLLKALEHESFLQKFYYPYTPKELLTQIYKLPNWEYYALISDETLPDKFFVQASWEIFSKYPWYPIAFTARNMWYFLYNPGYGHSRYNAYPFGKQGVQSTFEFDGENAKQYLNITQRGKNELEFPFYDKQPKFLQDIYNEMKAVYVNYYDSISHVMFYFIFIAMIAATMWFLRNVLSFRFFKKIACSSVLEKSFGPIVSVGGILIQSMVIVCMFAEPTYRYHHFIIPLKVIVAFYGLGLCLGLPSKLSSYYSGSEFVTTRGAYTAGYRLRLSLWLGIFILLTYLFWAQYIWLNT